MRFSPLASRFFLFFGEHFFSPPISISLPGWGARVAIITTAAATVGKKSRKAGSHRKGQEPEEEKGFSCRKSALGSFHGPQRVATRGQAVPTLLFRLDNVAVAEAPAAPRWGVGWRTRKELVVRRKPHGDVAAGGVVYPPFSPARSRAGHSLSDPKTVATRE